MEPETRRANPYRRSVRNAWIASIAGLLIYLMIPWWVSGREITGAEPYRGFRVILWLVSAMHLAVALWWTRRSVSQEAIMNAVRGTAIDPLAYFAGKKIAAISMAQSLAVYGMVLAIIGRYFWDQYVLTLISTALLIRHYPRADIFESLEREGENERSIDQQRDDS